MPNLTSKLASKQINKLFKVGYPPMRNLTTSNAALLIKLLLGQ